ncbi:MAG: phospholipid carrier-dependent glycosyltransferase [Candidatus Binataceae bacterium]
MLPAKRSHRLALAALVAALLYLPGLRRPALWEPDEGRYAEIAREMVASRDYVTPRDDFEVYLEKPPLVYWAEAGAIGIFGPHEFAVRLPAALFSIGEVVLTALIAEEIAGPLAGLYAALALALSPLFFGFARFATLDPALSFFLAAAMGAFYMAMRPDPPDDSRHRIRLWMLVAAAMLALGTLAKGPVALALGGAIALVWLALEGRLGAIRRMPLAGCVILYAAIVVPWFALAQARNPDFLSYFFIHEHLLRYTESREHGWGPWFFIPIVIGGAWPWIFFVPGGLAAMWRRDGGAPERSGNRSGARFAAVWFAVIFIFFSIPRSKLGTYILPAFPALAIAAGAGLQELGRGGAMRWRRFMGWFAIVNAAVAASAAIGIAVALGRAHPALARDGIAIAAAVAAGAILMWAIARGGAARAPYAIGAMALAMVATIAFAAQARSDAAPLVSYRNLARAAAPYLQPGCALASYRHLVQSLPFYTHRRELRVEYWGELSEYPEPRGARGIIPTAAKLRERWHSGKCMVLVANHRDLASLMALLDPAPKIAGCEGKKFLLYKGDLPVPASAAECIARAKHTINHPAANAPRTN